MKTEQNSETPFSREYGEAYSHEGDFEVVPGIYIPGIEPEEELVPAIADSFGAYMNELLNENESEEGKNKRRNEKRLEEENDWAELEAKIKLYERKIKLHWKDFQQEFRDANASLISIIKRFRFLASLVLDPLDEIEKKVATMETRAAERTHKRLRLSHHGTRVKNRLKIAKQSANFFSLFLQKMENPEKEYSDQTDRIAELEAKVKTLEQENAELKKEADGLRAKADEYMQRLQATDSVITDSREQLAGVSGEGEGGEPLVERPEERPVPEGWPDFLPPLPNPGEGYPTYQKHTDAYHFIGYESPWGRYLKHFNSGLKANYLTQSELAERDPAALKALFNQQDRIRKEYGVEKIADIIPASKVRKTKRKRLVQGLTDEEIREMYNNAQAAKRYQRLQKSEAEVHA